MLNLKELSPEIQKVIKASYRIGTWDGDVKANIDNEKVLEYLQDMIYSVEFEMEKQTNNNEKL